MGVLESNNCDVREITELCFTFPVGVRIVVVTVNVDGSSQGMKAKVRHFENETAVHNAIR